jgi:hypothetical protein
MGIKNVIELFQGFIKVQIKKIVSSLFFEV